MDLFYEYTEDNLMLQGTYFDSDNKDICILFVHGQVQSSKFDKNKSLC